MINENDNKMITKKDKRDEKNLEIFINDNLMVKKGTEKDDIKFSCVKCDYHTCHRGHWRRHLSTAKHKMITNDNTIYHIITKNINSSLINLGHTNPCSKKKSNPISFSKKCKKQLYSIMQ